jgi:hypothetical protein
MKIEAGKNYITRAGRVATNVQQNYRDGGDRYPFRVFVSGNPGLEHYTVTAEGGRVRGKETDDDLVAEISSGFLVETVPASEITLNSLVARGFRVRSWFRPDLNLYRVEIDCKGVAASADHLDVSTAVRQAYSVWELGSLRDYVAVLYVLGSGVVTTTPPGATELVIARKVVRFTARPGDKE